MYSTLTDAQIFAKIAEKKQNIKYLTEKKTTLLKTKSRIANTNKTIAERSRLVQEREEFVRTTDKIASHTRAASGPSSLGTFVEVKNTLEELKPLYAEEDFLLSRLEEVQKKIREAEANTLSRVSSVPDISLTVSDQTKKLSTTHGVMEDLQSSKIVQRVKLSEVPESVRRKLHREDKLHYRLNPDLPRNLYDNCKREFHLIARQRGWIEDEGISFDHVLESEAGGDYVKAVEIMEKKRENWNHSGWHQ